MSDSSNILSGKNFASWFRETTPYISAHRGKTFVISLPGEALEHANLTSIVHDIALLNVIGVRVVIVHGARPQLDNALGKTAAGAARITSESDLPSVTAENAKLRALLESRFSAGLPGSPLHNTQINLVSGNFVVAKPMGVRDGINYEFTGQVRSLKTGAMGQALDNNAIVLLSPSGISPAGQQYNLSAEELAAETAMALNADKLITFAEQSYIKDASGNDLAELTPGELHTLLGDTPADDPAQRRLLAMLTACRHGVPRCAQVSYADDGSLLAELFTADGRGSQLSEELYRYVRPATVDDLAAIVALIRPLEQQGFLVRRSRAKLERDVESFLVAEVDNTVVGCCALYPFPAAESSSEATPDNANTAATNMMELACFAAHPGQRFSRTPVGDQLLAAAEHHAKQENMSALFVLTTNAQDWFSEHGFTPCEISQLPAARTQNYDKSRRSQALKKTLSSKPPPKRPKRKDGQHDGQT